MTVAPDLVIDGEAVAGGAGRYPVFNPIRPTEVVLEAPSASERQLDDAVRAARRAQPNWAALPVGERAARLTEASALAAGQVDTTALARLLTREHGKVLWESTMDVETLFGMAGAFSPLAEAALVARSTMSPNGTRTLVERVPTGVVGVVVPFNWPVSILGNKVLPALLTGNAVVVKSPPTCPGAVLAAAAALAGQLPPGLLNVLNGPDAALGERLVAHPGIDMVTFTGGPAAGRSVMAGSAGGPKPVVLELGGNDPAIVAPDATIDQSLADRLIAAAFVTSGQVCMAVKRLYVPTHQLGAIVEALVERLSREVIGDGLREEVSMGPVHTPAARRRAEAMVSEAVAGGVRVHRPGAVHQADRDGDGYLVSPAIVENPPPTARVVVDEQFAPLLPVLAYTDLDDAVRQANDTTYGLCASVWSGDPELAGRIAAALEVGSVFINDHGMSAMDHLAPFGGWKSSGVGHELGEEGMQAFTRVRVVRGLPPEGAGQDGRNSTP